jgi:hypothetical protein
MHARSTFAGAAVLAALVLATAGPPGYGGEAHRTPQEVFEAARKAAKAKDYKTFMKCLTDDSQDTLAGGTAFAALMMKGFVEAFAKGDDAKKVQEMVKNLDAVLARHGLTEEAFAKLKEEMPKDAKDVGAIQKVVKTLVRPIKDKAAFFGDIVGALEKLSPGKEQGGPFPADAELKDVKIDGATAAGVIVSKQGDKEKREPIHFRRVGEGWKIDLPLEALMKKGGPAGP